MNVFVVMGNDYPDAVFASEQEAELYCEMQKAVPAETGVRRIYWRTYEFPLKCERLAGIPDPAAYVKAFDGMERALEAICDDLAAGDLENAAVIARHGGNAALTAARQARGGEV